MAERYEDRYRYGRDRRDRDREYSDDRGYMERAGDEVRSWFGDEEAERRRREDEVRDHRRREHESRYRSMDSREPFRTGWVGANDPRGYQEASWRTRDRDLDDRRRTWSGEEWRDRDRGWGEREGYGRERSAWRAGEARSDRDRDREPPYVPRSESVWSTDEGRAEFSRPQARGFAGGMREEGWRGTDYGTRGETGRSSGRDYGDEDDYTGWGARDRGFTGRGPKGYQRSDTRIYEDVCDRLSRGEVDASDIEVTVSNGEVTLSGTVPDRWHKRRAEDIVEEVSGVREVHNSVRVSRGAELGHSETSTSPQPGSMLGVSPDPGPAESTTEVTKKRS